MQPTSNPSQNRSHSVRERDDDYDGDDVDDDHDLGDDDDEVQYEPVWADNAPMHRVSPVATPFSERKAP